MRWKVLTILLFSLLFVNLVSSSFDIGDEAYSLVERYPEEAIINGWVNMSFDEEPSDNLFIDSFSNSISLLDLLTNQTSSDFECSPFDCGPTYGGSAAEGTKIIYLEKDKSELIGIKFTEDMESIESISFKISSDAGSDCESQVYLDFFDNGEYKALNTKSSSNVCDISAERGCFEEDGNKVNYDVLISPYCQRIEFPYSPSYQIGGKIKQKTTGTSNIIMKVYTSSMANVDGAYCSLNQSEISGTYSEVSCEISGENIQEGEEYYVCMNAGKDNYYQLEGNSNPEEVCGFYGGSSSDEETSSYNLFVRGYKFDAFGTTSIENNFMEDGLNVEAEVYLRQKFSDLTCNENSCYIPVRILSNYEGNSYSSNEMKEEKFEVKKGQKITLSDLEIKYTKGGFISTDADFFILSEIPSKISADFQKIYLDKANFSVQGTGEKDYKLSFNGESSTKEIIEEEIEIEDAPTIDYVTPTSTASAYPTTFTVKINGNEEDIESYSWSFGDNSSALTTINEKEHIYEQTGNYTLIIETTDLNGFVSTSSFEIEVQTPEEKINSTLEKIEESIEEIEKSLINFDSFSQKSIRNALDLDKVATELEKLKAENKKTGKTEEELNSLMASILELGLPEDISLVSSSSSLNYAPLEEEIDLDLIAEVYGEPYSNSNKDSYIKALLYWNQRELKPTISFEKYKANYGDYSLDLIQIFDFNLEGTSENYIVFIKKMEGIEFDQAYGFDEIDDYYHISSSDLSGGIIFSTTEVVSFADLPMFVSPAISELAVFYDNEIEESNGNFRWALFVLIVLLLALLGIGSYIFLAQWYKSKYENHLFKNKNNLYNLATFIHNSKSNKKNNGQIEKDLKKAGWSSEQVRYAMKKYAGKNTGLPEIKIKKSQTKTQKRRNR